MDLIIGYLLIFTARMLDMGMATIRMIMVVRGKRLLSAVIGFIEAVIYVLAIGKVLDGMDNPMNVFVYALGFAAGNYVGVYLEEKMALGSIIVQVISEHKIAELVEKLRDKGFGVTVIEGYGRNGIRHLLNVTLQRKNLSKLYGVIDEHDEKAFMTITDARAIRGGYFTRMKRK